jgi:hypothetical protein
VFFVPSTSLLQAGLQEAEQYWHVPSTA